MGEYAKAEPLLLQARDICKNALGEQHPRYAVSLKNLAGLYESMGQYAKAADLYQQAAKIEYDLGVTILAAVFGGPGPELRRQGTRAAQPLDVRLAAYHQAGGRVVRLRLDAPRADPADHRRSATAVARNRQCRRPPTVPTLPGHTSVAGPADPGPGSIPIPSDWPPGESGSRT